MKLAAKTIGAIAAAVSVILGGAELRIKVGEIDSRLSRIERQVDSAPRQYASVADQNSAVSR